MRSFTATLLVGVVAGLHLLLAAAPPATNALVITPLWLHIKFTNPDQWAANQALLLELLLLPANPDPLVAERLRAAATAFDWSQRVATDFIDATAPLEFVQLYESGQLIAPAEPLSKSNAAHMREANALLRVLLYTNDFAQFYEVLRWARFADVNAGVYVYALTLAVAHRLEYAGYELPSPAKIFPDYPF